MIVAELAQYFILGISVRSYPFMRASILGAYVTADYWTTAFGAPVEDIPERTYVMGVIVDYDVHYSGKTSLADSRVEELSFYWDDSGQVLSIHYDHDIRSDDYISEYATPRGFTDSEIVEIDGREYLPLIQAVPSAAQTQDLLLYDEPAYMAGSVVFDNANGELDYMIAAPPRGAEIFFYHLERNSTGSYTRADMSPISSFYVESFAPSLQTISFFLQDRRKAQDAEIPVETFEQSDYPYLDDKYVGKYVPLAYGPIEASEAIPINSEEPATDVRYRQALLLTVLGTVQIQANELWATVDAADIDLTAGSFSVDARLSRDERGRPRPCRVLGSVGIANSYAPDVIANLNDRFLGIRFTDSNYDTAEWNAEKATVEPMGILFDGKVLLSDAIRRVQAEASVGFRYEFLPDGRRTIRLDDWNRAPVAYYSKEDIFNFTELPTDTKDEILAAIVRVLYARDYMTGQVAQVENSSFYDAVRQAYRIAPLVEVEIATNDPAVAVAAAAWYAVRLSAIRGIVQLELVGEGVLDRRIYDVIHADITPGDVDREAGTIVGRVYYGLKKVQILSVDPDYSNTRNVVTVVMIGDET